MTDIKGTIDFLRHLTEGCDPTDLVRTRAHHITALLDEIDRLHKVIDDHNTACITECSARQAAGRQACPMSGYPSKKWCSDCPKAGMVEGATSEAGDGQPKGGA